MLPINEIKEPNLICTKGSLAGSHINEWEILDKGNGELFLDRLTNRAQSPKELP